MPTEYREIGFTEAEKEAAVLNYCLYHELELPEAEIKQMAIDSANEEEIALNLVYDTPGKDTVVTLNQDQVAAALVLYCQTCRIPIPKVGMRSLRVSEDMISLVIRIDRTPRKSD